MRGILKKIREKSQPKHGIQFWFQGWKTTTIWMLATLSASAGVLWLLDPPHSIPQRQNWPTVEAKVVDVRIMNNRVYPWGEGPTFIQYEAEYKLRYLVNNNTYEMWTGSGIQKRTRNEAASEAAHDRRDAHYLVRYNPKHPSNAEAERQ